MYTHFFPQVPVASGFVRTAGLREGPAVRRDAVRAGPEDRGPEAPGAQAVGGRKGVRVVREGGFPKRRGRGGPSPRASTRVAPVNARRARTRVGDPGRQVRSDVPFTRGPARRPSGRHW